VNYAVIAEYLGTRGRAASPEQVEEAELRARVRFDPHLAPAASTESGRAGGRSHLELQRLGAIDPRGSGAGPAPRLRHRFSVDVLGARAAGLDGVLLDPHGFWAPRDCRLARGLVEAEHLALGGGGRVGQAGRVT
jgi:hypothetical protein